MHNTYKFQKWLFKASVCRIKYSVWTLVFPCSASSSEKMFSSSMCTAQCTGWTLAFSGLAPSSEEEESSSMRTEFHNRLFNACAERKPPSFLALPSHAGCLAHKLVLHKGQFGQVVEVIKYWDGNWMYTKIYFRGFITLQVSGDIAMLRTHQFWHNSLISTGKCRLGRGVTSSSLRKPWSLTSSPTGSCSTSGGSSPSGTSSLSGKVDCKELQWFAGSIRLQLLGCRLHRLHVLVHLSFEVPLRKRIRTGVCLDRLGLILFRVKPLPSLLPGWRRQLLLKV